MRTYSNRLRLPKHLPFRPRVQPRSFDWNGYFDPDDAMAPRSDHSPTAPPVEGDSDRFDRYWLDHAQRAASGITGGASTVRDHRPDLRTEVRAWPELPAPAYAEYNTSLVLRSRRLRNDDDVAELRELVGRTLGVVHVGHLIRHAKCGHARAFTAIVNLIDDGLIEAFDPGRIRPELRVRLAA